MDEYIERQMSVLRRLIDDYRTGRLSLNTLIQRIEGVSSAINDDSWKNAVFPIVLEMEQINAASLNSKKSLSPADKSSIEDSLRNLEKIILNYSPPSS